MGFLILNQIKMVTTEKRSAIKAALIRAFRCFIAICIAGAVVQLTNDPEWAALAPILMGLGKWLRDEYQIPYLIV